jgi:Spy/CpxP family protein refolding chaperone
MNRRVLTAVAAVVVLMVLAAGFAVAQHGHMRKRGGHGEMDLLSGRMFAHMEARLNLTPEQSQQIKQIKQQQREQRKQQVDRSAHEALVRVMFSDKPDQAEIQKLTQQLQQQHAARLNQMVTTAAQINQVLTSEQRAELQKVITEHQQVREKMKQRREERRRHTQQKQSTQ